MTGKRKAPRLTPAPNRLGTTTLPNRLDLAGTPDTIRNASQPWRQWMGTQRWKNLKQAVHLRDRWICQQTGTLCLGKHPAPDSPVAHHKVPHRGDPVKFWDKDNIETVTKQWHDSEAERAEIAAGRAPAGVW